MPLRSARERTRICSPPVVDDAHARCLPLQVSSSAANRRQMPNLRSACCPLGRRGSYCPVGSYSPGAVDAADCAATALVTRVPATPSPISARHGEVSRAMPPPSRAAGMSGSSQLGARRRTASLRVPPPLPARVPRRPPRVETAPPHRATTAPAYGCGCRTARRPGAVTWRRARAPHASPACGTWRMQDRPTCERVEKTVCAYGRHLRGCKNPLTAFFTWCVAHA